ncbi:hypothetical protein [Cellvibrio sp. OA-2007]|uniref:hypothetical protein n=1 Tax=Cellvibrio sp. OA-2007 TaxID=529823 RepID=UPI000785869C|nr:hypothetical protein [Cellvibrio sp. OA-2007]
MNTFIFGMTTVFVIFIKIPSLFLKLTGLGSIHTGLLGGLHKSLAVAISLFLTYALAYLIALALVKFSKIESRLPAPLAGKKLILFGSIAVLLAPLTQIVTASIPGGGASFTVRMFLSPITSAGAISLALGMLYLLLEVKPSGKFTYPE